MPAQSAQNPFHDDFQIDERHDWCHKSQDHACKGISPEQCSDSGTELHQIHNNKKRIRNGLFKDAFCDQPDCMMIICGIGFREKRHDQSGHDTLNDRRKKKRRNDDCFKFAKLRKCFFGAVPELEQGQRYKRIIRTAQHSDKRSIPHDRQRFLQKAPECE